MLVESKIQSIRLFFIFITIGLSGLFIGTFSNAFSQPSLSAEVVEWRVSEGTKLVWIVDISNESLGYLPVNSRYELTIESISSTTNTEGYPVDTIYATLMKYNSSDESMTLLLDDVLYIHFNVSSIWWRVKFDMYSPAFLEHGFIMPISHRSNVTDGLFNFFGDTGLFDSNGIGSSLGKMWVNGRLKSTDLRISWYFNTDNICSETRITNYQTDEVCYSTYLEGSRIQDKIPLGNFYLIIASFMVLCIVYISYKKIRKNVK